MIRSLRTLATLVPAMMLMACTLSSPEGGAKASADAGALSADAIEVTTLEASPSTAPSIPAPAETATDAATPSDIAPIDVPPSAETPSLPEVASTAPPARPVSTSGPDQVADPSLFEEAAPAPVLSPEGQACVESGGMWVPIEGTEAMACVTPTRDGGKICDQGSDCQGECLSRSGTCAPFAPLFGCNDVLDDEGRQMTLCLD